MLNNFISTATIKLNIVVGGECFPSPNWWSDCRAPGNQTRLYSLYGTTELSCWAMLGPGLDLTLGTAMTDTLLRVETGDGSPGSTDGELFIGVLMNNIRPYLIFVKLLVILACNSKKAW